MNKFLTSIATICLMVCCFVTLSACGGNNVLYQADFSNANDNAFKTYSDGADVSTVTVNTNDKYVVLGKNEAEHSGYTSFGKENKNTEIDFNKAVVTVTVEIKSADMQNGDGFNWSIAANDKQGNYKAERSVYVGKIEDKVKVGYVWGGSGKDENTAAISKQNAAELADGKYDISFAFKTENNVITSKITVANEQGTVVFEEDNVNWGNSDFDDAANQLFVNLNADEVGGLRYGWFSWQSFDNLKVFGLKIVQ